MNKKLTLGTVLFTAISIAGFAQGSIVTVGGDATGSGGSVSYSVGQIADTTTAGPNGSVSQGVQQPIEILVVGVDNAPTITLTAMVYPNPTTSNVILKTDIENMGELSFQLFDMNGKLIATEKVNSTSTNIPMENLAGGTYFLKVIANKIEQKTFKIIKTK